MSLRLGNGYILSRGHMCQADFKAYRGRVWSVIAQRGLGMSRIFFVTELLRAIRYVYRFHRVVFLSLILNRPLGVRHAGLSCTQPTALPTLPTRIHEHCMRCFSLITAAILPARVSSVSIPFSGCVFL
jgi:hypothetical protein